MCRRARRFLLSPCVRDKQRSVGSLCSAPGDRRRSDLTTGHFSLINDEGGAAPAREEASVKAGAAEPKFNTPTGLSRETGQDDSYAWTLLIAGEQGRCSGRVQCRGGGEVAARNRPARRKSRRKRIAARTKTATMMI